MRWVVALSFITIVRLRRYSPKGLLELGIQATTGLHLGFTVDHAVRRSHGHRAEIDLQLHLGFIDLQAACWIHQPKIDLVAAAASLDTT